MRLPNRNSGLEGFLDAESEALARTRHKKTFAPAKTEGRHLKICVGLFPHPVFGETVARAPARDLMSVKKQVF